MRQDQKEKLEALQEKIAEILLDEMNPENWAGAGKKLVDMTKDQRGNRYFDKKNAAMTAVLYVNNDKLLVNTKAALGRDPYEDEDLDKQIRKAEKAGDELLEKVKATSKKTTHGKNKA